MRQFALAPKCDIFDVPILPNTSFTVNLSGLAVPCNISILLASRLTHAQIFSSIQSSPDNVNWTNEAWVFPNPGTPVQQGSGLYQELYESVTGINDDFFPRVINVAYLTNTYVKFNFNNYTGTDTPGGDILVLGMDRFQPVTKTRDLAIFS